MGAATSQRLLLELPQVAGLICTNFHIHTPRRDPSLHLPVKRANTTIMVPGTGEVSDGFRRRGLVLMCLYECARRLAIFRPLPSPPPLAGLL